MSRNVVVANIKNIDAPQRVVRYINLRKVFVASSWPLNRFKPFESFLSECLMNEFGKRFDDDFLSKFCWAASTRLNNCLWNDCHKHRYPSKWIVHRPQSGSSHFTIQLNKTFQQSASSTFLTYRKCVFIDSLLLMRYSLLCLFLSNERIIRLDYLLNSIMHFE